MDAISFIYDGIIRLYEEDPHKTVIVGFLCVAVCVLIVLYIWLQTITRENNTNMRGKMLPYCTNTGNHKQTDYGYRITIMSSDDTTIKVGCGKQDRLCNDNMITPERSTPIKNLSANATEVSSNREITC